MPTTSERARMDAHFTRDLQLHRCICTRRLSEISRANEKASRIPLASTMRIEVSSRAFRSQRDRSCSLDQHCVCLERIFAIERGDAAERESSRFASCSAGRIVLGGACVNSQPTFAGMLSPHTLTASSWHRAAASHGTTSTHTMPVSPRAQGKWRR